MLMERAAGNSLFLRELASAGQKTEDAEDLPDTVESLVATCIDQLAPGDRALLRWASVSGVPLFGGALIIDVLEDDLTVAAASEAWDRFGRVVERDLTSPELFASGMPSSVTRRTKAFSQATRCRELHGLVAEVIEAQLGDRVNDVRGAPLAPLRPCWELRQVVAVLARGRRTGASEMGECQRPSSSTVGRSTWPRPCRSFPRSRSPRVWQALGDCLHLLGSLDDAAHAYTSAREFMPKGTTEQIELMRTQGLLRDDMGRYPDALRWYTRALKATEAIPDEDARSRLRIRLRLALAQTRYRQGAFTDCIRRFKEVVQECLAVGDSANLAPAYLILHLVHTQLGSPDRVAYRGLALALYEELGATQGDRHQPSTTWASTLTTRVTGRVRSIGMSAAGSSTSASAMRRTSASRQTTSARSSPIRGDSRKQKRCSRLSYTTPR